jgi:hypothetical protein
MLKRTPETPFSFRPRLHIHASDNQRNQGFPGASKNTHSRHGYQQTDPQDHALPLYDPWRRRRYRHHGGPCTVPSTKHTARAGRKGNFGRKNPCSSPKPSVREGGGAGAGWAYWESQRRSCCDCCSTFGRFRRGEVGELANVAGRGTQSSCCRFGGGLGVLLCCCRFGLGF